MIDSYEFGRMIIDGISHSKDLVILPEQVEPNWWRQEGHCLHSEDLLERLQQSRPEVLIIGTGKFGMMKIPDDVKQVFENMNIVVITRKTDDAVVEYNKLSQSRRVVGAFHLTC